MKNAIENFVESKIEIVVEFFLKYSYTLKELTLHPTKTFSLMKAPQSRILFMGPFTFFTCNIVALFILNDIKNRIAFISMMHSLGTWNDFWEFIPGTIVPKLILGTILFAILSMIAFRKTKPSFLIILKSICFCSAIFIPTYFVRVFTNILQSNIFLDFASQIFFKETSQISIFKFFLFIISLLLIGSIAFWWLNLFYKSFFAPLMRISKFRILIVYIFFYLIGTFFAGISHLKSLKAICIINSGEIQKSIEAEPPNYFKAQILANKVAQVESLPSYIKYAAIIRSSVYKFAFLASQENDDNETITTLLTLTENREHRKAQKLLEKYLNKAIENKEDTLRVHYHNILKELNRADEFYASPDYVERPESLSLLFSSKTFFIVHP